MNIQERSTNITDSDSVNVSDHEHKMEHFHYVGTLIVIILFKSSINYFRILLIKKIL